MRRILYLCLALVSIGLLAGCKSSKVATVTLTDLDGEWGVVEMNGKALNPAETNQVLAFDVPRRGLGGNAGCNRIMGQIDYNEAQKNIIKFSQVGSTRMACPDMSGEQELLNTLPKVVRFASEGEEKPIRKIALYGIDNTKLFVLEKQK